MTDVPSGFWSKREEPREENGAVWLYDLYEARTPGGEAWHPFLTVAPGQVWGPDEEKALTPKGLFSCKTVCFGNNQKWGRKPFLLLLHTLWNCSGCSEVISCKDRRTPKD